eukprot:1196815-Rhodomonas_salina.2
MTMRDGKWRMIVLTTTMITLRRRSKRQSEGRIIPRSRTAPVVFATGEQLYPTPRKLLTLLINSLSIGAGTTTPRASPTSTSRGNPTAATSNGLPSTGVPTTGIRVSGPGTPRRSRGRRRWCW